ncbi:hypothetical protein DH2020_018339 [Rehmannia glutinosa]|uniref:DUF4228 domain protein n=1 Tax=Rehmannia glutinosa TaxID=99300 RepID=A0ABR0WJ07_REHGL
MGSSFSCKRLSLSTSKSSKLKNIRIVHLDGYVEQLDYPITVAELTGNQPKHLLFTHSQLLSNISKPLKSDTVLEPGKVYYMLPYSLFGSNVSPMDLAPITRKLASTAQHKRYKSKSSKKNMSSSMGGNYSPVCRSPANSSMDQLSSDQSGVGVNMGNDEVLLGMQKSSKSRSWKPILDTIREKSSNRRSESELQENMKVDGAE